MLKQAEQIDHSNIKILNALSNIQPTNYIKFDKQKI